MSRDDETALGIMQDTVKFVNGKYVLPIPRKIDPYTLPNNYCVAEKRLKYLKKKFENDSKLQEQYTKTVSKYVEDGHACVVGPIDLNSESPQWFLPHHAVFKRSNPEKCRVVFDCAAKFKGTSLNDAIHQGPNLLNNLSGVLIRFRAEHVAVVADIRSVFRRCCVAGRDRGFLRFLWWPEGDVTKSAEVYAMQVHLFGATSSPSVVDFCIQRKEFKDEIWLSIP